jgi:hypothetical protein
MLFRSLLRNNVQKRTFIPKVGSLGMNSTLGEVVTVMYTNYPQRSIYPLLAWAGVLYYVFWNPYVSEKEKKVWLNRQAKLKALEFHQDQ